MSNFFFFQAPDQVPGSRILEMKINLLPFLLIKKPTYKFRNKSASLGMDISDGNASAWNPCRLLDPLHTKIQDMWESCTYFRNISPYLVMVTFLP